VRQLTLTGLRQLEWLEVDDPSLEGGDALVEPVAVATCDMDALIVSGEVPYPLPIPMGHEAIARVVEVGEGVKGVEPGALVAIPFQISCGECGACREGRTCSCETVPRRSMYGFGAFGRGWGGALSDRMRVPFADFMLVPVPSGLDPIAIASVTDNVVDGWRCVAPQLEERPGGPVLVVGGSASVGLYAAGIAVALGAERVDYLDRDTDRLERADQLGANAIDQEPPERIGHYPITVDASGTHEGLGCALRSTTPDGLVTVASVFFEPETPLPMLEMYTRNITMHTGRVHARAAMPAALELIADGRFRPELVTARVVPWDDAAEALVDERRKLVFARHAA
jgi:threonine dehydrogenase-like Zn-dependent dehydrogenase